MAKQKKAIADFCIIASFYFLRVGKYTNSCPSKKKAAVEFRLRNVNIWGGNKQLSLKLSLEKLLRRGNETTLRIDNPKNSSWNQTIHHYGLDEQWCPCIAVIRRAKHIFDTVKGVLTDEQIGNLRRSSYFGSTPNTVRPPHINAAIKNAVISLKLDQQGLTPDSVSSHSLGAGGAMAMYMNGAKEMAIQKWDAGNQPPF